ncbi:MAG: MFS transporter [Coxiellaceae bacterium]|jgi:MFS family permease|nr:MFS transporter [Coxiellaceae bacterium]
MGHKNCHDKLKKPRLIIKSIVDIYKYIHPFKTLPKGMFAVSLFGLFLGASTTMVYSQLPMFMKYELHASALKIAFIDGVVEFLSFLVRIFSGAASDYIRNRKFILLIGSLIILSIKPLFALAKSAAMVMFAQSVDRIGNGFQASPRDALIADLSNEHTRGQSFGFSKSLKTIGSLLGSAIAIALMYFIDNNYRIVFMLSIMPVIIAIICLYNLQSHKKSEPIIVEDYKRLKNPFKGKYLKSMDMAFWKLIILASLCELGHFSEHLLVLRANDFIGRGYAGSVGIFISIGQVLCSYPIGLYADKLGKKIFIQLCMIMMIVASASMIYAPSISIVFFGAFLWGGQMTAIQGLFLSIISDKVDKHLIGTAIGIYYLTIGVSFLVASMIAGHLWNHFGSNLAFIYNIFCVLLSLSMFSFLYPKKESNFVRSDLTRF